MTKTSIIIPTYNGLRQLRNCVDSIRQHTPEHYELIVIDNASTDGTAAYCRREKITFISLPDNRGFPAACNLGLRLAAGDELLLLNNDVVVSGGWLGRMRQALYSAPDIGLVGPVTNYASGRQQVETSYADLAGFHAEARRLAEGPPRRIQVQRLVGLCLLFRRSLLDRAGLLDEGFSPGHYEDDDYCYRTRLLGFRLLICADVLIHHEGSASFRTVYPAGFQEVVERGRQRFMEKWNRDPAEFM